MRTDRGLAVTRGQLCFAVALWLPAVVLIACNGGEDADDGGTAPSADELVFETLGDQALADTGAYVDMDVTVPEGAVSSLAWCGGWGDDALGAVWTLSDASGSQVYAGDGDVSRFRSDFLDDMSPALLPITPKLDIAPGTWSFQWFVGANGGATAHCEVVHRVDEVGDAANLLVELVFVGLDGLDASTAPDDPDFQAVLQQLEAEWASAGLTPTYSYVDFAGDATKYVVVDVSDDDMGEFNDLLRESAPENVRTLSFFLVEEIANASAGGATILGLSGGPPGAAAFHGTSKSGVVVSTIDYADAPEDVGKIMAHEGGHFLGLYHTSEKDGALHDILDDTPQCPSSADADGDGILENSECSGQGAENVMWWTLTEGVATFSEDQGWVLRRNPVAD